MQQLAAQVMNILCRFCFTGSHSIKDTLKPLFRLTLGTNLNNTDFKKLAKYLI